MLCMVVNLRALLGQGVKRLSYSWLTGPRALPAASLTQI